MKIISLALHTQLLTIVLVLQSGFPAECCRSSRDENEDEVVEVGAGQKAEIPCEEEILMEFLAEMQAVNPESIVNLSTKDTIEKTCKRLHNHGVELSNYLSTCQPPHPPDLYMDLLGGVQTLEGKLCDDRKFQSEFKTHVGCLLELSEELDDCAGPADWEERGERQKLCRVYEKISNCFYIKTATVCGLRAARSLKSLLTSVVDSIVKVECDNVLTDPYVADPMPDDRCSAAADTAYTQPILLLAVLAVLAARY